MASSISLNRNNNTATQWRGHHLGGRVKDSGAAACASTPPGGEENHWLDHQELEHGVEGAEQLTGGEVKEKEGVERQDDRDVVDDGHVQVTAGNAEEEEGKRCQEVSSV